MTPPNTLLPIRLQLALLASFAAVGAASPGKVSAQVQAFVPPEGPVLVSRTLIRHLPDGKEVRTVRSYRVWFSAWPISTWPLSLATILSRAASHIMPGPRRG